MHISMVLPSRLVSDNIPHLACQLILVAHAGDVKCVPACRLSETLVTQNTGR